MAEQIDPTLRKISEQLTCPVCLEAYTEPKVLDCHHVFCCQCLERLSVSPLSMPGRRDRQALACPTCREETILPDQTVSKLKPAFHIHSLFDIKDTLLEQRLAGPTKLKGPPAKTLTSEKLLMSLKEYCPSHPNRLLEMYCKSCVQPICCACIVKEHEGHSFRLIADILQQERSTVSSHRKMLEQQLQVVGSLSEKVELESERVRQKQAVITDRIQRAFELFQKVLNLRRSELIDNLNELTELRLGALAAKTASLERIKASANEVLATVEQTLQVENVAGIVTEKKRLTEKLEQIGLETSEMFSDQHVEPDFGFFYGPSTIESISTVGKIYTQVPSAQNSSLQVADTTTVLHLGDELSLFLDVKDQYGSDIDTKTGEVQGKVSPCGLSVTNKANSDPVAISKCPGSRYKISTLTRRRGRHKLEVRINGEHVQGSPLEIFVRPPPNSYGSLARQVRGLSSPWGVTIDSKDQVIVTELGNHHLLFFNKEAEKILQRVGKKSILESHFQQPACVCADRSDQLYITEMQTFAIKKCSANGHVVKSAGSPGQDGPLRFMSPVGLCVNPRNGNLYVADMENNRIQILDPDLTFNGIITGSSDNTHSLCSPSDIAFEPDGTMYVTDCEDHCIQVYSPQCEHLRSIGKKGKHKGQLGLPFGICLDGRGHIFVAELYNNRVSIFSTDGDFVACFGSHGAQPGQFNRPNKIAVDKAGYLYVTDTGNKRLQVF